jgi:hypothetical protein
MHSSHAAIMEVHRLPGNAKLVKPSPDAGPSAGERGTPR